MKKPQKKLGAMLVEAGLVTRLEVDHALQAQQIFGGRLGTNLVEMGALDDDTLAGFLAQQLGVPRITIEEMENVSPEVLDLVPAKAAQRLCILPISRKVDQLVLAMMDPTDTRIRTRLEKNLELWIEPRIATEVEIRYFLENYYGVQRDTRHVALMDQTLKARENKEETKKGPDPLTQFLDQHLRTDQAISFFCKKVASLERVPVRNDVKDLTEFDLTPEMTFLLFRADGISSMGDLLMSSSFARITTLRALIYLQKLGLLRFDPPFSEETRRNAPKK